MFEMLHAINEEFCLAEGKHSEVKGNTFTSITWNNRNA